MNRPAVEPVASEDAILECLARRFENAHPRLNLCRGDDCALFKGNRKFCASSDLFLEDVHFRRSYFSPREIGRKALAVNVSDLAACGAKPVAFLLNLGLPGAPDAAWLDEFFGGMAALAKKYDMVLAGGDLSRADKVQISITVIGETRDDREFLTRGGAMPGDAIFVVGPLGLARIGLRELERIGRPALDLWPESCRAHLEPTPMVEAGLMLARAAGNARPPALMDLSDGIARDLPRLLGFSGELATPSGKLGARLELEDSRLPAEVTRYWKLQNEDPALQTALGGEDYALLGACAADMAAPLKAAIPGFVRIGEVTDDGRILCNGVNLRGLAGFDHFESD